MGTTVLNALKLLLLILSLLSPVCVGQVAPGQIIRDANGRSFSVVRVLGQGGFAIAVTVVEVGGGEEIALKVFKDSNKTALAARNFTVMEDTYKDPLAKDLLVETRGLEKFTSDGVLFHGQFMELMSGDSLGQVAKQFDLTHASAQGNLQARIAGIQTLLKQMLAAQALLMSHDLVHNDIKPSNYQLSKFDGVFSVERLVAGDLHIELADFDTVSRSNTPMAAGTPLYMAPEKILNPILGSKSVTDFYSIGASVYELMFGRPFALDYLASQGKAGSSVAYASSDRTSIREFLATRLKILGDKLGEQGSGLGQGASFQELSSVVTAALDPEYSVRAEKLANLSSLKELRPLLEREARDAVNGGKASVCGRLHAKFLATTVLF